MTAGAVLLTSDAYGTRVGVRTPPGDVAALRRWLPFWWVDATDGAEPDLVWDLPVPAAARSVVTALELTVAERAEGRVFVHAAVVALGDRALLLPGPSHAGKSTLADALVRAGATYGSDEYAPLGPDGAVHPYPRPLRLRDGQGEGGRVASDAGAGRPPLDRALPVAAIAFLQFATDGRYRIEAQSAGAGVLGLLANTVCARSRPVEALSAHAAVVAAATVVTGTRGEAADAVAPLLALLGR